MQEVLLGASLPSALQTSDVALANSLKRELRMKYKLHVHVGGWGEPACHKSEVCPIIPDQKAGQGPGNKASTLPCAYLFYAALAKNKMSIQ